MREVVLRTDDGRLVCARCAVADSARTRMKGLLGRDSLADDEGIYIKPGGSIHTAFMRFPIDVLFVDKELRVLRIVAELPPWKLAAARRARAVVELAAGAAARAGVTVGDRLVLGE